MTSLCPFADEEVKAPTWDDLLHHVGSDILALLVDSVLKIILCICLAFVSGRSLGEFGVFPP